MTHHHRIPATGVVSAVVSSTACLIQDRECIIARIQLCPGLVGMIIAKNSIETIRSRLSERGVPNFIGIV